MLPNNNYKIDDKNVPNESVPLVEMQLVDTGDGKSYKIQKHKELVALYEEAKYQYLEAPNLTYVDFVSRNSEYFDLSEIWVLKSGKKSDSTNSDDWDIYSPGVKLTTNESDSGCIYVQNGTVIRLVYEPNSDKRITNDDHDVYFFDYDITDGTAYRNYTYYTGIFSNPIDNATEWSTKESLYMNTRQQGINNPANFIGSGVKLAFGNSNDNTGNELGDSQYKGFYINQANKYVFGNCVFGIMPTLDKTTKLPVPAEGIISADLFGTNDSEVIGKSIIDDWELEFNRSGITYTLNAVTNQDGEVFDSSCELGQFTLYGTSLWSNNFWPMDNASTYNMPGHDMAFGSIERENNSSSGFGNGFRAWKSDAESQFSELASMPASDDGLDHNSYFALKYKMKFTLEKSYIGPLEYIFFGDDDMWVYLEDEDGNCDLICDIGGVHSSAGEYVNLWDYIDRSDFRDGETSKDYTLYFFYTERGASGSTCYMEFTIPQVFPYIIPAQAYGDLKVSKEVDDNFEVDKSFNFEAVFTDEDGNSLSDQYSYTIYDENGLSKDSAIFSSEKVSFSLKAGEYAVFNNLPDKTNYTIKELKDTNYLPEGNIYEKSGQITTLGEVEVHSGSEKADNTTNVEFKNILQKGSVKVTKTFDNDSDISFEGINNIQITIQRVGNSTLSKEDNTKTATLCKDNNWTYTFDNLYPGEYLLTELADVDGYEYTYVVKVGSDTPNSITVSGNSTTNVTLVNKYNKLTSVEYKYDDVKVYKTDNYNKPLSGVKFGLYEKSNDKTPITEYTTDKDGIIVISSKDTALKPYLPEVGKSATLYLGEIASPTGYTMATNRYEVKITSAAGEEALKDVNGIKKFVTEIKYDISFDGKDKLNVVNNRVEETEYVHDQISINKKDYDSEQVISGAKLGIYENSSCTGEVIATYDMGSVVISTSDEALKDYLPNENNTTTLYIKEISAPTGYSLGSSVYPVVIKAEKSIAESIGNNQKFTNTITYTITVNSQKSVDFYNRKITDTESDYHSLNVVKTDSSDNSVLSGASFAIYENANDLAPIKTFTAGDTMISLEDAAFKEYLPNAGDIKELYIKELTPPKGYEASSEVYKIIISASEREELENGKFVTIITYDIKTSENLSKLTVKNKQKTAYATVDNSLKIIKTDEENNILEGAEFGLFLSEGASEAVYTFEAGEYELSTANEILRPTEQATSKTLYLKEITPPDGYVLSEVVYPIVVQKSQSKAYDENKDSFVTTTEYKISCEDLSEIKVENEKYYAPVDISVEKIWIDNNSPLRPNSVNVSLYMDNELYEEDVVLSKENNWSYTWQNLAGNHEYCVEESNVPSGYKVKVTSEDNRFIITNISKSVPKTGDNSWIVIFAAAFILSCSFIVKTLKKQKSN